MPPPLWQLPLPPTRPPWSLDTPVSRPCCIRALLCSAKRTGVTTVARNCDLCRHRGVSSQAGAGQMRTDDCRSSAGRARLFETSDFGKVVSRSNGINSFVHTASQPT